MQYYNNWHFMDCFSVFGNNCRQLLFCGLGIVPFHANRFPLFWSLNHLKNQETLLQVYLVQPSK